jgi:hypothetical protein
MPVSQLAAGLAIGLGTLALVISVRGIVPSVTLRSNTARMV